MTPLAPETSRRVDAFFRGALDAWLKGRRPGETFDLGTDEIHGRLSVEWSVATVKYRSGADLWADEIPAQARRAGARAIEEALKEVRE